MNDLTVYFQLGFHHILVPIAWDHVLFVVTLCLLYIPKKLKPLFWLITAFTIGHSITLVLVALKKLYFNINVIEFLIPITIVISAFFNIFKTNYNNQTTKNFKGNTQIKDKSHWFQFVITCFFGMVHGIAFATETFGLEGSEKMFPKIIGFNIGIEVAQLVIVVVVILISYIFVIKMKLLPKIFIQAISIFILIFSVYLSFQNFKHI